MTKTYWKTYQSAVADNHYYYERSCIRQSFFPGSENIFLKITRELLNKDIIDDKHLHTCTGIGYYSGVVPIETTMTVVARLFALMTEAGYKNFVPSCVTSFGLLNEMVDMWQHFPEKLNQTKKFLKDATGRTFEMPDNIAHPSDIIYKNREILKAKMKYQLVNCKTNEPLQVVDHVGCHYSKIFPKIVEGGAEFPQVLSGMIKSWGGRNVDYPERRHCCGFGFRQYLVMANRGYSVANTKKKFESMKPYKPDFILANCPGCAMFMDRWQYTIAEMEDITYDDDKRGIPVLTYEELVGLLLGYNPWDLGLQVHQVQVEPLLEKIGIPFDSSDKYRGKNNEVIGSPNKPLNLRVK